jgi:hypothetical protein
MSEFLVFVQLGFRHIVALDAADHILFLLALAAIYRGRDWRAVFWVITAFTVGHSLTLALAVLNVLSVPRAVVEFLIPVTIVLTGLENLILRERAASGPQARHRPIFAGVFGLVHGAGFADYLRSLFVDRIAVPLVGFNVGIEAGQIIVLAATAVVFLIADRTLAASRLGVVRANPFRLRLMSVSAIVTAVASVWAWERWPQ